MNLRCSVVAVAFGLSVMGCSRTVYVQDDQRRPIEGAKVTLTNEHGSTSVVTGRDGYARIPRAASKTPGTLGIEKEGYEAEELRYPGNVSIIEDLDLLPARLKAGG